MTTVSSIARSGMQAATKRIGAAAHNVAIAPVEGAQRQVVNEQTLSGGGVAASFEQAPRPDRGTTEDLAGDLLEQQVATYAFKANLKVVEVEHSMLGALLDEKV